MAHLHPFASLLKLRSSSFTLLASFRRPDGEGFAQHLDLSKHGAAPLFEVRGEMPLLAFTLAYYPDMSMRLATR